MDFNRALRAIVSGLILALLAGHTSAQVFPRGNGLSLAGLTQADLHVQVDTWQDLSTDPSDFRLQAQGEFESRLRTAGITRRPASRDYLVCKLQAIQAQGQVTYSTTLEYWGRRSTDVHTLLWQKSAMASVSQRGFDADRVAGECASGVVSEWSKWNPAT